MNKHITDYLNYYIDLEKPQYAVLLIGNWGCGKTFFIKNAIANWTNTNIESEKISLKPIYVSLNGISNTHSINEKIRAEISPFLYSKGMKVAKKVLNGLLKTTVKIDLNLDEDDKSDGNFSFNVDSLGLLDSSSNEIKGKRILIFDDIERCKIETDEIFGYINNFVEHSSCKVILLTDEKKIKDKYEKSKTGFDVSYKDFKEKLVGQTFEVKSDIESAINFFIEDTKNLNENSELIHHNQMIIDLFKSSKLENLRVLKQALLDFSRIIKNVDPKLKKHENYPEFTKNFLTYFIIIYAEFKTGNDEIKNFQTLLFVGEKEKENKKQIESKYQEILSTYNIYHSSYTFSISKILYYIENGFIETELFNNELKSNTFFRQNKEQDWEKLWYWTYLEDADFKKYRDSVWSQFTNGKIDQITVLIHISGIFLKLIDAGLLSKNKAYVLSKSKQILKTIFSKDTIENKHLAFGHMNSSWGKQYQSQDTIEFKSLREQFNKLLKKKQSSNSKNFLKDIFENLNSNSLVEIYSKLKEAIPDATNVYERTAIFKDVNGNKLGRKIKLLNNKALFDFKNFIHSRYYPEETYSNVVLQPYHKDDLTCLIDLKDEIQKNRKKRELIKNRLLTEFKNDLENIIEKVKSVV
ncbi:MULTISPECIES: P-loop NTPase fold protein [Winogradskyella]|uniref:P-loop NTPase fold protein n=1 Tax=Winogradskyella TaxID=286104 RepID=UPI0015CAF74E|nr:MULTISPECIES: P-loop NTPase fold protein [Winogradskyella]QXP78800.1 hypothetical protein H0I32_16585 [Winogradskyella sp. HaHa_3_26]